MHFATFFGLGFTTRNPKLEPPTGVPLVAPAYCQTFSLSSHSTLPRLIKAREPKLFPKSMAAAEDAEANFARSLCDDRDLEVLQEP